MLSSNIVTSMISNNKEVIKYIETGIINLFKKYHD